MLTNASGNDNLVLLIASLSVKLLDDLLWLHLLTRFALLIRERIPRFPSANLREPIAASV